MRRREFLKYTAATALAAPFVRTASADTGVYKVGVVGAKTGPLAPGAAITHFPPYQFWAHEVNERGGLKLKDGQRKIQIIEYDDHTAPPEAIKAVERAGHCRQGDWIGGVYATGFNLATAPTFAKHGYPQLTQACVTDQGPLDCQKISWLLHVPVVDERICQRRNRRAEEIKDAGQIGNKVAAVNVGDDFGIELANAGRPLFKQAGFETRLRQVISAWHAGLHAGRQGRQRRGSRRVRRLVLSAGYVWPSGGRQDRSSQGQGLLLCRRLRISGFRRRAGPREHPRRGWRGRYPRNPRFLQTAQRSHQGRRRLLGQPVLLLDAPGA